MPSSTNEPESLTDLLALEIAGEDHYRATFPRDPDDDWEGPVFGGMTLGCAARAAGLSCPDRPPVSLTLEFLRPVPLDAPVDFVVTRIREGRRVAHRRVDVRVDGRLAAEMRVIYAQPEKGRVELAGHRTLDGIPEPDSLRSHHELRAEAGLDHWPDDPMEWRYPEDPEDVQAGGPSFYRGWVRPRVAIDPAPWSWAAAFAYLSDYHSHFPVARMVGGPFEPVGFASLDTAIWFHRAEPWTGWLLLESECDVASGGRALMRRQLYNAEGRLLASMAQQALVPYEA